jgi:hypothetical protein
MKVYTNYSTSLPITSSLFNNMEMSSKITIIKIIHNLQKIEFSVFSFKITLPIDKKKNKMKT